MRCTIVLLAWLASNAIALGAGADRLADFATAMTPIMANLRTAASYARTGNVALAQIETDEAVARWKRLGPDSSNPLPAYAPAELSGFLDRGRERLVTATGALDRGETSPPAANYLRFGRLFTSSGVTQACTISAIASSRSRPPWRLCVSRLSGTANGRRR
ncbi:hypothetical protein [Bradyrhizobium sp. WSM1253]|uniref:hypothetical protein n=1 Tax=Bradyrhizobium sp. WSM1253 TaxID=319003 RepID=UPI0002E6B088|nr:hypothetical protein [Bradyrhizobium sp. WSM1253]